MKNALSSLLSLTGVLAICAAPAFGNLIDVDLSRNIEQTQLNAGGSLGTPFAYFAARAFYGNPGDFDGGTLTITPSSTGMPGSPIPMTNVPGTYTFLDGSTAAGYFLFQTAALPSQADLDASYPFGDYVFNLTNSGNPGMDMSTDLPYQVDLYPSNQPVVTSSTFNALSGMDTTHDFTVNFNAAQNNMNADVSYEFLDIYSGGTDVYSTSSSTPVTSFVIPHGALAPNTAYTLVLTFDDRATGADGTINQSELFDNKTDVGFTTGSAGAAPEPGGMIALAPVFALAIWLASRRRFATQG